MARRISKWDFIQPGISSRDFTQPGTHHNCFQLLDHLYQSPMACGVRPSWLGHSSKLMARQQPSFCFMPLCRAMMWPMRSWIACCSSLSSSWAARQSLAGKHQTLENRINNMHPIHHRVLHGLGLPPSQWQHATCQTRRNPRDSKMSIDAFSARLARLGPSHTGFESRLCPSRLAPVRLSRLPRPRPVRRKGVCAALRLSSTHEMRPATKTMK